MAWIPKLRARGQGDIGRQAHIDSDRCVVYDRCFRRQSGSIVDHNADEEFARCGGDYGAGFRSPHEPSVKERLHRSNLGQAHSLGGKVDGEELGHIKGLAVRLAPLKLWVAQFVFSQLGAAEEVLKGQVEPLDGLLEGLRVGVLEKGMVLF